MLNNFKIYGLIDPRTNELRYVGFTTMSFYKRLHSHISESRTTSHKSHKVNWIKTLLRENLKPEMIELQTTNETCWELDEQWNIQYFRSIGCRLTNGTNGGERCSLTPEVKIKMSKSKLGIKYKPRTQPMTEEGRRNMAIARLGNENSLGFKQSKQTIEKRTKSQRKLTDEQIIEIKQKYKPDSYPNARDGYTSGKLSKEYGIDSSVIRRILHNQYKYLN